MQMGFAGPSWPHIGHRDDYNLAMSEEFSTEITRILKVFKYLEAYYEIKLLGGLIIHEIHRSDGYIWGGNGCFDVYYVLRREPVEPFQVFTILSAADIKERTAFGAVFFGKFVYFFVVHVFFSGFPIGLHGVCGASI
jgi:hypothetical protein